MTAGHTGSQAGLVLPPTALTPERRSSAFGKHFQQCVQLALKYQPNFRTFHLRGGFPSKAVECSKEIMPSYLRGYQFSFTTFTHGLLWRAPGRICEWRLR